MRTPAQTQPRYVAANSGARASIGQTGWAIRAAALLGFGLAMLLPSLPTQAGAIRVLNFTATADRVVDEQAFGGVIVRPPGAIFDQLGFPLVESFVGTIVYEQDPTPLEGPIINSGGNNTILPYQSFTVPFGPLTLIGSNVGSTNNGIVVRDAIEANDLHVVRFSQSLNQQIGDPGDIGPLTDIDLTLQSLFLSSGQNPFDGVLNLPELSELNALTSRRELVFTFDGLPVGQLNFRRFLHYSVGDFTEGALVDDDETARMAVPEPAGLASFGLGLAGLWLVRRRRRAV